MNSWFDLFFKKRQPVDLKLILPVVMALTAFASGFIALNLAESFLNPNNPPYTSPSQEKVRDLIHLIRIEVLAFTILGALAGWGIAIAVLNPLKRVMGETHRIAQGDFSAHLETEHLDEMAALGKDINKMASSLNKYFMDNMAAGWMLVNSYGNILALNMGAQWILQGTLKPVDDALREELSRNIRKADGYFYLINQTLSDHQPLSDREISFETLDGRSVRVLVSTSILKGDFEPLVGMTLKDLTRAEAISDQMFRTDRLAALGVMAANLAHEIRNPLGSIKGLTQLLQEKEPDDDTTQKYTRTMVSEIDRLNGVVSNLLNFAQSTPGNFFPVDLNKLIHQTLDLIHLDLTKQSINVERDLNPGLPRVSGDDTRLVQAFLNLLLNATQAVGLEGTIRIVSKIVPINAEVEIVKTDSHRIQIEFFDNGPPVDPAVQAHMFDPFFSTKKEGTGLGLAITHQIIHRHKGTVAFSRVNEENRFCLTFPVSGETNDSPETSNGLKAIESNKATS